MYSVDLDRFSAPGSGELPSTTTRPPRHKAGEWFVKGPIPGEWLRLAALEPGKTLHVAMALWYMAGLTRWPRIFHNLRSTRQTELDEIYPTHVVCRWMGNSPQVARTHYLQLTDEHFERATRGGAECGAQVAQKPAQQAQALNRKESPKGVAGRHQPLVPNGVTRNDATTCEGVPIHKTEVHGNRTHLRRG